MNVTIKLDGSLMIDRDALHDYLKLRLDLPDYYGKNLDALYDILTERLLLMYLSLHGRITRSKEL